MSIPTIPPQSLTPILKGVVSQVYGTPIEQPVPTYLPRFAGKEDAADVTIEIKPGRDPDNEKYASEMAAAVVYLILYQAEQEGLDFGSIEAFVSFIDGWSGMPKSLDSGA